MKTNRESGSYLTMILSSLAAVLFIMAMAALGLGRLGMALFFSAAVPMAVYFWFKNYRGNSR